MWDSADWSAVVFVSDRTDAALRRRERCLKLAGIASSVVIERRPSGTYYKLSVREGDVLDAHLALRIGGFCKTVRLRTERPGVRDRLEQLVRETLEEALLLLNRLVDFVRETPRLLAYTSRG
jgi:hypothetical protein